MSSLLTGAMRDLAEGAGPWGDASAAVAEARRRRRISVTVAAVAVAAGLLGVLALAVAVPGSGLLPVSPAHSAGPVDGYPPRVGEVPWWPVRDLPDAPGPAAAWIAVPTSSGADIPFQLVMPDGTRFRIPVTAPTDSVVDVWPALSPDGRRLAFMASANGPLAVHDLVTGEEWSFPVGPGLLVPPGGADPQPYQTSSQHPWFWSPDGSRLLVVGGPVDATTGRTSLLLDMARPGDVVVVATHGFVAGWLPDSSHFLTLVGSAPATGTGGVRLHVVSTDGVVARSVRLHGVTAYGAMNQLSGTVSPDGTRVGVTEFSGGQVMQTLVFDVSDGRRVGPAWGAVGRMWCRSPGWDPALGRPLEPVRLGEIDRGAVAATAYPAVADSASRNVVVFNPALDVSCFQLAQDALAAGPTSSLLGTRTSWWSWHAVELLLGGLALLLAVVGLLGVSRRSARRALSANQGG